MHTNSGMQPFLPNAPSMPPPDNFSVTSPPMSPLVLPVQRRAIPPGPEPSSPRYNNVHMTTQSAMRSVQNGLQSARPRDPSPQEHNPPSRGSPERSTSSSSNTLVDEPQPSPPLPNPYDTRVQDAPHARRTDSTRVSRPGSMALPRPDLPPSNVVPRPDIPLPPRMEKQSALPPHHRPKKLVMPAPLQQKQPAQRLEPGQAHVAFLAQRHGAAPAMPPTAPSSSSSSTAASSQQQQQQPQAQARAKDIPISHGPNVLKKRHTLGGPQPLTDVPASNTTAAMFAARVRFSEPPPPRTESKEERKRREKEEKRERDREK